MKCPVIKLHIKYSKNYIKQAFEERFKLEEHKYVTYRYYKVVPSNILYDSFQA